MAPTDRDLDSKRPDWRPDALPLNPLEVASGLIIGATAEPVADLGLSRAMTPLTALEGSVLAGLTRPPCLVSFSGGRDSSAILAVAADLARREGLDLPVPATIRFPNAPETDEASWQEEVIRHLGLVDWHTVTFDDELDLLGPTATKALRRHGLLWPSNSHFHVPLLEAARGGSLLTGIGGDEVLGWWPWARAAAVLSGEETPRLRDVLRVGLALAPRPIKRAVFRRRGAISLAWLRPAAAARVRSESAAEDASMPHSWRARGNWLAHRRYLQVNLHSMNLLARDTGTAVFHPMLDGRFLVALGSAGRRSGFPDRTEAMLHLFSGLLPVHVLRRTSMPSFDTIFWHRHSRSFAEMWDGGGVDTNLVDPDKLQRIWLSDTPDGRSSTLLQAAWIAGHG